MFQNRTLAAVVALFVVAVQSASAVQVGLGASLAGATNNDGAGSRMNIEEAITVLGHGDYRVDSFEFLHSSDTNNLQPFLAIKTGAQDYTILWVGPAAAATGPSGINTISFSGQSFNLLTGANVVAGFNAAGPVVQFADPDGPTTTDHNNPANFSLVAGNTLTSANFTNANLPRNYAFAVNVTAIIPEPATATLGLLSVAGLMLRRRRLA